MPRHTIFWPVLCLVLWTFLVLVQVPIRRFHAAFKGRVVAAEFRCGGSEYVPAHVALPNRVFMDLVEVPTLFSVVCLILYVTGTVTPACVALAWLYFALRIAHSLIYLTYNHVVHRFAVFATSNLVVLAMLTCLAVRLSD